MSQLLLTTHMVKLLFFIFFKSILLFLVFGQLENSARVLEASIWLSWLCKNVPVLKLNSRVNLLFCY